MELNAKPATGRPSRTTSVITATTEVVISEKSKPEFASDERSGIAVSRISTMRMEPCSTNHSIFGMLASRMIRAQSATSALILTPNSSGVSATGVKPMAASRSFTSGSTIMRAISR